MTLAHRRLALGALVMLIPLGATFAASGHPVDDGSTYRWVNPPHSRLTDNIPPAGRVATLPPGSPVQAFWTPDLQLTLTWAKGGVGDKGVTVDVQPIDPATLGELPDGVSANGNAYRVALSPVDRLGGGAVYLAAPTTPVAVFHSGDGRSWRKLPEANGDEGLASAVLERDGFVVAVSTHRDRARFPTTPVAVVVASLGATIEVLRRIRRRGNHPPVSERA